MTSREWRFIRLSVVFWTLCKSFEKPMLGLVFVFMWGELGLSHKGDSKSGLACACVCPFRLQTSIFCEPPTVYRFPFSFLSKIYIHVNIHMHTNRLVHTVSLSMQHWLYISCGPDVASIYWVINRKTEFPFDISQQRREREKIHQVWKWERDTEDLYSEREDQDKQRDKVPHGCSGLKSLMTPHNRFCGCLQKSE